MSLGVRFVWCLNEFVGCGVFDGVWMSFGVEFG